MKLKTLFLTLILFPALQADISDIKFTTGYRRDNFSESVKLYTKQNTLIGQEEIKGHNISTYQLGGKARVCAGGISSRAEINFGWVNKGRYSVHTPVGFSREGSFTKGKMRSENVGVAYFLMNNSLCQIGPSAGYAKTEQHFSIGKKHSKQPARFKLTNQWKGPWVGADAACQIACLALKAGYEYHFADWKATSKFTEGSESISANSSSKHARGRVVYAEASWNFSQCFTLGSEVKWQKWSAKKTKSVKRLFNQKSKTLAKWDSLIATVDIGYSF